MKLKLFKISAFVVGAFALLVGTEARAQLGPPPPIPPSLPAGGAPPMPPSLPAGGPPRIPSGGPPRAGGFNRPSVPGGGFRAGGSVPRPPSRAPNISRPGPSRTGGLAPNSKLAGGGPGPQFPSKIQSLPKGSGSVLPSIAQGNKPGAGPAGKG